MMRKLIFTFLFLFVCAAAKSGGKGLSKTEQELNSFLKGYVEATNSHDFANVQTLLLPDAVYWFNKSEHHGINAIRSYFEAAWQYLPDEVYGIENVKWLSLDKNTATCIYEYTYQGTHEGKPLNGRGRGTSILVKQGGRWHIAHEHLSTLQ